MKIGRFRRKPPDEIARPEGREYPRLVLNLPIEYHAPNSGVTRTGYTFDLGAGGVMLNVPERLKIGQQINMAIFFSSGPSIEAIKVNSQVVWVDAKEKEGSYRLGAKFVDLSPTDRSKLEKFFEKF